MKTMIVLFLLLGFTSAFAADIKFGAFIDTYYAYDSNLPRNNERAFITQPERHNEPGFNLVHGDVQYSGEKVHGRLAVQGGNSVEKNTKGGPDERNFARYVQESYVGVKLGDGTWIDAGIFLGNIGMESWISKDNWTYTRSLFLDYVPYYSSGVRLSHQLSTSESFQLQVLNGWQNINETNDSKAIGLQYQRPLSEKVTFTYNNFLGDERIVSKSDRFRGYHNFILKWLSSESWNFLGGIDFGHQAQQKNSGIDAWAATSLTARQILSSVQSLAYRLEYYLDPHQSNIVTGTKNGFNVVSASMNYDQQVLKNLLWRTEVRGFFSKDEIYPDGERSKNRWDGLFVTSLSWWI